MHRVAVIALAGVALALVSAGEADGSPGSPGTAIVSLGDSFISGEGGRWLGNGSEPFGTRSGTDRAATDCDGWGGCEYEPELVYGSSEESGCHRSDAAPVESAPVAVGEKVNLACSGARIENVWPAAMGGLPHFGQPPQADALGEVARRADVKMVVVTVGAMTSASASWWWVARSTGPAAPSGTRFFVAAALGPRSPPACPRWSEACGGRLPGYGWRWRVPATGARTIAWW
jgi:hypothetical protein